MVEVESIDSPESILVVGGGISGITAAIEAAEVGYEVILTERAPFLGGRVVRSNRYFPKLCAPTCGLEINFRRMKSNPRVKLLTLTELESISGQEGAYEVTLKSKPGMVNDNCTICDECAKVCPVERPNDFNFGLDNTKAIYLPHSMAFPTRYVIDPDVCKGAECNKCVEACAYDAIDLNMPEKTVKLKVGSVVMATGWDPYDATKLDNLGFGAYENVINNVMMERLASDNGPTEGKIVRPSDGAEPKSIAFVQCAGSRDENHLPYCSGVCCMASLKQVTYVKERYPDAEVFVFYIDIRALGMLEDFYRRIQEYENLSFVRGKVAKIEEDPQTKNLTVEADDTLSGSRATQTVDMVVLATGIVPSSNGADVPADLVHDEYGFIASGPPGISAAGCAKRPIDVATSVQDSTGAALKAIQSIVRSRANG